MVDHPQGGSSISIREGASVRPDLKVEEKCMYAVDSLVMQDGLVLGFYGSFSRHDPCRDGTVVLVFLADCTPWTVENASYVADSQSFECGYVTRDVIRPVANACLIVPVDGEARAVRKH